MANNTVLATQEAQLFWESPDLNFLVNREEQRETFIRALQAAKSSRPAQARRNVLEWHGGPGIGKTTLVRLLRHECEQQSALVTSVNFLELESQSEDFLRDPTCLLEVLLDGFQPQQSTASSEFKKLTQEYRQQQQPPIDVIRSYFDMSYDDRLYTRPEWLDHLNAIVIEFLNLVQSCAKKRGHIKPVVFMFDETESVDVELADWLEEWVISPLSQMSHAVVVWTSRKPWRWKRPEVRRRLQSEELKPFERDAVKRQLAAASSDELAQALFGDVYVLTGGHPFANAVVISQLNTWEGDVTSATLDDRKAELFDMIFQAFIRDYVLRKFDIEVRTACELLAHVRLFDTTMVSGVLKAARDDTFGAYEVEQFGELFYKLKKTQLLVWAKGYAIDPNLRYLIQQYYATCRQSMYITINDAALKVYRDWLTRPVDNRGTFVIEELYHLTCKKRAGEDVDLESALRGRLQQYLEWFKDSEALRNALDMLKGELEHDTELSHLTEEYSRTMLAQVVQEFKNEHA